MTPEDLKKVFSFGKNRYGQLGQGDKINKFYPTAVNFQGQEEDIEVKGLSAGESHSAVLTNKGEVFTWGSNTEGQCGRLSNGAPNIEYVPKKVDTLGKVSAVECGKSHTLFLVQTPGDVFACGENKEASLGTSD